MASSSSAPRSASSCPLSTSSTAASVTGGKLTGYVAGLQQRRVLRCQPQRGAGRDAELVVSRSQAYCMTPDRREPKQANSYRLTPSGERCSVSWPAVLFESCDCCGILAFALTSARCAGVRGRPTTPPAAERRRGAAAPSYPPPPANSRPRAGTARRPALPPAAAAAAPGYQQPPPGYQLPPPGYSRRRRGIRRPAGLPADAALATSRRGYYQPAVPRLLPAAARLLPAARVRDPHSRRGARDRRPGRADFSRCRTSAATRTRARRVSCTDRGSSMGVLLGGRLIQLLPQRRASRRRNELQKRPSGEGGRHPSSISLWRRCFTCRSRRVSSSSAPKLGFSGYRRPTTPAALSLYQERRSG